ncbi:unnamed protein product [Gadus morhua 'NCC']
MLTDASPCQTTDSVNAATVEDPLPYYTCDTGTQCILKPLGRSHGSMAAVKLEGIITRTSLLKDVRQLSPQHQTYSLEAFHSLILHFAPKHTGFSYHGMYSRKGAWVVVPIKEKASYGYATSLIEALRESYMDSPKALQEPKGIPTWPRIPRKTAKDQVAHS